MMHKHTITMNKPWSHADSFGLHIHELVAKLRNAMKIEIPTGYQDESGFHMGKEAAKQEVKWPPTW